MVSDGLVATTSHAITHVEDQAISTVAPEWLGVHLAGAWRSVSEIVVLPERETNIALLRLKDKVEAKSVRIGFSEFVRIGHTVVGIGFHGVEGVRGPEDSQTVRQGIVNKVGRFQASDLGMFKIGFDNDPGMDGAPLFNELGEVIAVIWGGLPRVVPVVDGVSVVVDVGTTTAVATAPLRRWLEQNAWSEDTTLAG